MMEDQLEFWVEVLNTARAMLRCAAACLKKRESAFEERKASDREC
jgi:hypothetical protein